MLNSLEIKNFRNLNDLRINSLERVNLITGKNNTGKSTILEAISLYASKGDISLIFQLLDERGEKYKQVENNKNSTEINIKALSSLFTNREVSFSRARAISIGSTEASLFGNQTSLEKSIALRFVKYYDDVIGQGDDDPNAPLRRKRIILENDADKSFVDYTVGLEVRAGTNSYIVSLDRERPYRFLLRNVGQPENFQLIRTRNIDREINGKLWDYITLSEKEQYVINALQIIEPKAERIAFIEDGSRERTAVIKLTNNPNVLPLKSMGDGINRILTIILALVNSDNGFLFIDEFENGLHYSVQEKLWEIVFKLAQILNVQVFATTHSEDCISSFESVLNSGDNLANGKLIRLDFQDGKIKQVEFNANELRIATDHNIETR